MTDKWQFLLYQKTQYAAIIVQKSPENLSFSGFFGTLAGIPFSRIESRSRLNPAASRSATKKPAAANASLARLLFAASNPF